jgi:hypothetical protein
MDSPQGLDPTYEYHQVPLRDNLIIATDSWALDHELLSLLEDVEPVL